MNPYLNQYKTNSILTASREQILLMLYDGAIRFVGLAKQCMLAGDMAGKGKYIGKTIAILAEFSNTLDRKIGGELADNLDALYGHMIARLGTANIQNTTQELDEVRDMLSDLRQTWAKAIELNSNPVAETEEPVTVSAASEPLRVTL